MARTIINGLLVAAIVLLQACQTQHQVQVAPVEVKPIHITIDVNVKIDQALEDYFGEIDSISE